MHCTRAMLMVALLGSLPYACATQSADTPKVSRLSNDAVTQTVQAWVAAVTSADPNAAASYCSDGFQHTEWGDKSGLRDSLEQARVVGYLDGIKADTTTLQVAESADGAYTAGPVCFRGNFGDACYTLRLQEENGAPRIVAIQDAAAAPAALQ